MLVNCLKFFLGDPNGELKMYKCETTCISEHFQGVAKVSNILGVAYIIQSNHAKGKLDQGALGMSDPCGTLQLALKPNSVPRNNCLLTNFYFCAN